MRAIHARRFGFHFRFSLEAVQALALGLGVRGDLRTADRLASHFPDHLLHQVFLHLGARFREGNRQGLEISMDVSEPLRRRMGELLSRRTLRIWVESPDQDWLEPLGMALEGIPAEIRVVGSIPPGRELRPPCLLLRDLTSLQPADGAPETDLGSVVQARLVEEAALEAAGDPLDGLDYLIPVLTGPTTPALTPTGQERLREAAQTARLGCAWDGMRRARLRWRLSKTFSFDPKTNRVDVTLGFEAEERVLEAKDLRLETSWSEPPKERFADVAGHEEVKRTVADAVAWLGDPGAEGGLRAYAVEGPPGTGKTLLCAAVAGEAGVAYIHITASEWMGMWWGQTEKAIRSTFRILGQYDACVLVVEEFEGIAYARDRASASNPADWASILGTLLTCLDRIRQGAARVLFLATTNHYEQLDPAVVRSQRMGRLHLGFPGTTDRRALLGKDLAGFLSAEDLDEAARMTSGLSQADLVELARELLQGDNGHGLHGFQALVLAHRMGPRAHADPMSTAAVERIACHEAGHAVAAYHLRGPASVEHLSLVPSLGGVGGAFVSRPSAGQGPAGAWGLRANLAIMLAGRAAESLCFPEDGGSDGAGSDLKHATEVAVQAIGELGLDEGFAFSSLPEAMRECLAPRLVEFVQRWLLEAAETARALLQTHRPTLRSLADALAKSEILHRAQILAIIETEGQPPAMKVLPGLDGRGGATPPSNGEGG